MPVLEKSSTGIFCVIFAIKNTVVRENQRNSEKYGENQRNSENGIRKALGMWLLRCNFALRNQGCGLSPRPLP